MRALAAELGWELVTPPKSNRRQPWPLSHAAFRARNGVNRYFGRIKRPPCITNRYHKLAYVYFNQVLLTCIHSMTKQSARVLDFGLQEQSTDAPTSTPTETQHGRNPSNASNNATGASVLCYPAAGHPNRGRHYSRKESLKMTKNARPDSSSLTGIINSLAAGSFVVPDFQRAFEWDADDILHLVRSVFLEYYIGSLLLWQGNSSICNEIDCGPLSTSTTTSPPNKPLIVLDGQQRLTAMYYAFFAPNVPLKGRKRPVRYFVHIDNLCAASSGYASTKATVTREDMLTGEELTQEDSFRSHRFPVSLMSNSNKRNRWLLGYQDYWANILTQHRATMLDAEEVAEQHAQQNDEQAWQEATEVTDTLSQQISNAEKHVHNGKMFEQLLGTLLGEYHISHIRLDEELDRSTVIDIFTQINRRGKQLEPFDRLNAKLSLRGLRMHELAKEAQDALAEGGMDAARHREDLVRIVLLRNHPSHRYDGSSWSWLEDGGMQDGDDGMERWDAESKDFRSEWRTAVGALTSGLERLKKECHFGSEATKSADFVHFGAMTPVYGALTVAVGDSKVKSRRLRQWYWASVLTERYTRTDNAPIGSQDYRDMLEWFSNEGSTPKVIRDFTTEFGPGKLSTTSEPGPSNKLHAGLLSLLYAFNPRNWSTGEVAEGRELVDLPIVPGSWCEDRGVEILGKSPLNLMLVDAGTQKVMGEQGPWVYLDSLTAGLTDEKMDVVLDSHCLSREALRMLRQEEFDSTGFTQFLIERERMLLAKIGREIFDGLPFGVEPTARAMRGRREEIERRVRRMIADMLNEGTVTVSQRMEEKLKERYAAEQSRYPRGAAVAAVAWAEYLTYADLLDLKEIIEGKRNWKEFESVFRMKEMTKRRFDDLAAMRNADAHVREAKDTVVLDGAAALDWFESALGES